MSDEWDGIDQRIVGILSMALGALCINFALWAYYEQQAVVVVVLSVFAPLIALAFLYVCWAVAPKIGREILTALRHLGVIGDE